MNQPAAQSLPPTCDRPPSDGSEFVDLCFPSVDDLLKRLAAAESDKRRSRNSLLHGSRILTVTAVFAFICIPGCATATMLLMNAKPLAPPAPIISPAEISPQETQPPERSIKADRLSSAESPKPPDGSEPSPDALPDTIREAGMPDGISLRGTIEVHLPATSVAAASATEEKPERPAAKAVTIKAVSVKAAPARPIYFKAPARLSETSPATPSFLDKLFGVIASTGQHQA